MSGEAECENFFKAVKANDLDVVDEMLESKKHLASARNKSERNETALHHAAYKGFDKLAQLLVDKYNAEVNAVNDYGEIPLQIAKDNYHAKICKFLIQRNSDKSDYAKGLLNSEDVDAFFEAVEANNMKKVSEFIEKRGVNVNSTDNGNYRCTALHVAAKNGFEELVRSLVDKYNADINLMDDIGDRPIHCAAQNDHLSIAKFFIEKNCKDSDDVKHLLT